MSSSTGNEGICLACASGSGECPVHEDGCTCTLSPITLRLERAKDCPVPQHERVPHDSISWERIPEQVVCICAHQKGVHRNPRRAYSALGYRDHCAGAKGQVFRAIGRALEAAHVAGETAGAIPSCSCPGFHDVDERMNWSMFADRFLSPLTKPGGPMGQSRQRIALSWAWKKSGLDLVQARTWGFWLADSKRVWRAWRDAGSPMEAFGKERSFGPAEIPALEDR